MSSNVAPVFETRHVFVERIIRRLEDRGYPDKVVMKIVMPMLTGVVSTNAYKARRLMAQVCETEQDRHSFRTHFFGGD